MRSRPHIRAVVVGAATDHRCAPTWRCPHGDLLLMPGVRDGTTGSTVKVVTVLPENAALGRPTVQAVVLWLDAATGTPLAVLDGATITAMRTGAASGVATRLLARPDASSLGLLGVGAQAAWQVRAVLAARPISEVRVYARTAARREAFAAELADELGPAVEVRAAPSAEAAVRDVDVVCCATSAIRAGLRRGLAATRDPRQRDRRLPPGHGGAAADSSSSGRRW